MVLINSVQYTFFYYIMLILNILFLINTYLLNFFITTFVCYLPLIHNFILYLLYLKTGYSINIYSHYRLEKKIQLKNFIISNINKFDKLNDFAPYADLMQ